MSNAASRGERPFRRMLRIGAWTVDPAADRMTQGDTVVRVEARTMRLLLCLADRAGEVVSIDELLSEVWAGVVVTPDSVYQAVTSLRRLLGDDPKQPAYIATVPRRGYRLIATVDEPAEVAVAAPASPVAAADTPEPERGDVPGRRPGSPRRISLALGLLLLLCGALAAYGVFRHRAAGEADAAAPAARSPATIAVLPFLDLTDAMNEEPFADGMTEELIDKLSRYAGIRVSAPTSSFYYKNKKVPVAEIAMALGVTYVLDGSVRTSGTTMRVAARLVRAGDGFVVWSATYDRPLGDKLKVQDDIASEAAMALTRTIP